MKKNTKKIITTATALGVIMAQTPVYAMPVESEDSIKNSKMTSDGTQTEEFVNVLNLSTTELKEGYKANPNIYSNDLGAPDSEKDVYAIHLGNVFDDTVPTYVLWTKNKIDETSRQWGDSRTGRYVSHSSAETVIDEWGAKIEFSKFKWYIQNDGEKNEAGYYVYHLERFTQKLDSVDSQDGSPIYASHATFEYDNALEGHHFIVFKEGQVPTNKELNKATWNTFDSLDDLTNVWNFDIVVKDGKEVVVLNNYLKGDEFSKIEIPREIEGKRVELASIEGAIASGVTHIRVAEGSGDKVKLLDTNVANTFNGNADIEYIDLSGLEVENVSSMASFAENTPMLRTLNLEGWDISEATDFSNMIKNSSGLRNLNLGGWKMADNAVTTDVLSGVPTLYNAYYDGANSTTYMKIKGNVKQGGTLDVSNLEVEPNTSMANVFNGVKANIVGLETWVNTENITNMSSMFKNTLLTDLSVLKDWNTSNVTDMTAVFQNVSATDVDLSNWDVSSVTNMSYMFDGMRKLTNLNVSGWDTSKVTQMQYLFRNCTNLVDIKGIENWDTTLLSNAMQVFDGTSSLTTIDLSGWNMDNITETSWMFQNCTSLTEIKGIENWTFEKVTRRAKEMFKNTPKLKVINLSKAEIKSGVDITGMFSIGADASDEDKQLLVITNNQKIKDYNFKGSNRIPATITLNAKSGEIDGEATKTITRYTVTPEEFAKVDETIKKEIETIQPTKEGYSFVEWKLVGDAENTFDKFNATYEAVWELNEVKDLEFEITNTEVRVGNTLELVPFAITTDDKRVNILESENVALTTTSGDSVSVEKFTTPDQTNDHYVFHIDGLKVGETELTLTLGNITKTVSVNVFDYEVENGDSILLDLNGNSFIELAVNGLYPKDETKDLTSKTVFEVVDKDVARVTGNVLTGLKEGTTEIKVTTEGEEWTTITLNVIDTTLSPMPPTEDDKEEELPSIPPTETEGEWKKVNSIAELNGVWEYTEKTNAEGVEVVVLNKYVASADSAKVEIPRVLDGKPVELEGFSSDMFPNVTHIKIADGDKNNEVKLRTESLYGEYGFFRNEQIEYLDLRGLDVSNVTSFYYAFGGCSNLQYANFGGWNFADGANVSNMISSNRNLHTLDLSEWNLVNANTKDLITEDTGLRNLLLKDMNKSTFADLVNEAKGTELQELTIDSTGLDLTNVTSLENMFNGASGVVEIKGLDKWDVSSVTNMTSLFKNASNLTNLEDIEGWNTSSLTNAQEMFSGLSSLESLDITNWNMENVTELSRMFLNCSSLTELKGTENWTLSKVAQMRNVFEGTKLNVIDLSNAP